MNWDWDLIRSFSIALSASIATVTFVISTITEKKRVAREDIREWQKTVISELFQSKVDGELSFDEILRAYQSEANEYSKVRLKAGDLARQTLRRILVELIKERVIDQVKGDKYRLMTMDHIYSGTEIAISKNMDTYLGQVKEMMNAPDGATTQMMSALSSTLDKISATSGQAADVSAQIVNKVHEKPGVYRNSDLVLEISQEISVPPSAVKMQINLAKSGGIITEDESGFLNLPIKQVGA